MTWMMFCAVGHEHDQFDQVCRNVDVAYLSAVRFAAASGEVLRKLFFAVLVFELHQVKALADQRTRPAPQQAVFARCEVAPWIVGSHDIGKMRDGAD